MKAFSGVEDAKRIHSSGCPTRAPLFTGMIFPNVDVLIIYFIYSNHLLTRVKSIDETPIVH